MKHLTILGALALAVGGCAAEDSDLQYRGTLETKTEGVALFDNGEAGHAGMHGTTCLVDPDGGIGEDIDLEGEDDTIIDVTGGDDSGVVLARTNGMLHLLAPVGMDSMRANPGVIRDFPATDVLAGRLTDAGVVALNSCGVTFMNTHGQVQAVQGLDDLGCTGMGTGFDVDRANSVAYVATAEGVASVDMHGMTLLSEGADLLAFSPVANAVMVANHGDNVVRALEVDGTERWSTTITGTVHDVEDLGSRGSVALVVEREEGGALVLLNSTTGLVERSFDLPDTADLVTSANGQTLALVRTNQVHYYNLR